MKQWRYICRAFFAAMLLVILGTWPSADVYADEITEIPEGYVLSMEGWGVNPRYAEEGEELTGFSEPVLVKSGEESFAGSAGAEELAGAATVAEDVNEAAAIIREAMEARAEEVSFTMYAASYDEAAVEAFAAEAVDLAVAHTGSPTQGDYLAFQYGGYSWGLGGSYNGRIYTLEHTYTITY